MAPLLIKPKSLMRETYATGIQWKDTVAEDLRNKWYAALQEVNDVSITVPRRLLSEHIAPNKSSLWVFADASKVAIAVCAYLRCEQNNQVMQLISDKTRLAPRRTFQTIPRLEL
ncbi:hypothetical protein RB195_023386 [Necator americanus]|uniref:Reverse transcriptase/retrotransposon-derived protein RNase H-like domain-containing protein n=1 Tax=Necator americanus TaxID=51031 RepID=A0ABR1ELG8_NECAM